MNPLATKAARHGRITDLIRDHEIRSQTELMALLSQAGSAGRIRVPDDVPNDLASLCS